MHGSHIDKWLSKSFLKNLLLADFEDSKATLVQIARFCAAYYLDYVLFLPRNEEELPSLYLWGCYEEKDIAGKWQLIDRNEVSQKLPADFSPALPVLILVRCDHLIEAISYADHFDDRRSALVLRLLADSQHSTSLCIEYIKSTLCENVEIEVDQILSNNGSTKQKFAEKFSQSILELDVVLQHDLLDFYENWLMQMAEFEFSKLPLESAVFHESNPIYKDTDYKNKCEEMVAYAKIHATPRTCPTSTLHRVLLLSLRTIYRQKFSEALKIKNPCLSSIANRYKCLLDEENGECAMLEKWSQEANDDELRTIEEFFEFVQENFKQSSSLPPLSNTTREFWLRRIVFNNADDYRDIRQEKSIDWLRSVCLPKQRVSDTTISQMLFINSQWTPFGFSFLAPGCHAIRLSIHPHDVCLGGSVNTDYTLSARDVLYKPNYFNDDAAEEVKLFTPREDLITKYAKRYDALKSMTVREPPRLFKSFGDKLKEFSKQQQELSDELERERQFLMESRMSSTSSIMSKMSKPKENIDTGIAKQIEMLNQKLDNVVKKFEMKSSYIREDDEVDSVIDDLPYDYEHAPVAESTAIDSIGKLDLGQLSERIDVTSLIKPIPKSKIEEDLSTAQSMENPMFSKPTPPIPFEWMKLLPLEQSSARFADNFLIYDGRTPRVQSQLTVRRAMTDRQCQTEEEKKKVLMAEIQTDSGFLEESKKMAMEVNRMSKDEIEEALKRINSS
ncbi:unnamed protein product [Caenorhabditis bovis]|uniref:Uncharacterized protein n=1 Tax=Caenorhabditis bovis TaxID=2654633 RepID=A0A8S1EXJ6_9PELO|nr:unnamed protein product [Caenorhabditis bovis]